MTHHDTAPAPAPIQGTEPFTLWNAARLTTYQHRDTPLYWLIWAGVAAMVTMICWVWGLLPFPGVWLVLASVVAGPAMLPLSYMWARPWMVGYFVPEAVLTVRPVKDRWNVCNHHAHDRSKKGSAAPFRRHVFHALAEQADHAQVTIEMDTSVPQLREQYLKDMPGLEDNGIKHTRLGKPIYLLIRHPQPRQHPPNGEAE